MVEIYSILSLLAAFIYLQVCVYVLALDRRSPLNIVYALGCLSLFFYSACYFFYYRSATAEEALFFLRIGSIGWILIVAASFHFLLLLTRVRFASKWLFVLILYLPFAAVVAASLTGFFYTRELVRVNGVFFPVVQVSSPWYLFYCGLLTATAISSVAAILFWRRKASTFREKRQILVIVVSMLLSFPLIVLNNFILIPSGTYIVPDVSHLLSLINIFGALIAITKYRMMRPASSLFSDEVLSRIEDFLILLDSEGKIAVVNRRTCDVLNYRPEELSGKPAGVVVLEEDQIYRDLDPRSEKQQIRQMEAHLITRDGEKFPVQATLLPIKDPDGELNGVVVIGHDRAGERALGRETQKRLMAEAGEKKQIDNLNFLSKTAMNFIELREDEDIYHLIGQKIRELAGDSLNIVVSWSDYQKQFQVETVNGNQSFVSMFHDIIGGSMEEVILKLSPEAAAILAMGKYLRYSGGLYDLVSGMIPEKKCERIENDLGLKDIWLMGFTRGEKLQGGVVLFNRPGSEQVNRVVLEAFVHQASIAIQRKKVEEQLATSENLYRRLMETVFEAVVIHKDGKILYVNEKASKMMGLKPSEAYGRLLLDFVHPDSREAVRNRMRDMYSHGVSVPLLEEKFVSSDGKVVDVEVTATGFLYLDTPAVLVMFRDISYRKNMEAEMRGLQRQIEFILGSTRTGLDIIDSDMRIVFIDPEWKKTYGEPAGRKCYEYFMDTHSVCMGCNLLKAMEAKKTIVYEEFLVRENRWVQVSTIPYQDASGAWLYAEVNVDITERKKIEKEYMTACGEIETLNLKLESEFDSEKKKSKMKDYIIINQSRLSAMSEMLQNISHHWKEPLNNIGLLIQNIRSAFDAGKLDTARMDDFGAKGLELLYGMTRTLDNFGNFLKADRVKQSFCLQEAVDKAVSLANVGYHEADIKIVIEADEDIYVRGYLNETTQILVNLLNNSREAVVEKGVTNAFVKIALTREGENAVLKVTDNGGGIPADVLPRLFEPYFTTKKNSAGIGLFLSREFVEKDMEGKMTVTNQDGGVMVRIVFPKPK